MNENEVKIVLSYHHRFEDMIVENLVLDIISYYSKVNTFLVEANKC